MVPTSSMLDQNQCGRRLNSSRSVLAAVARDHHGEVLFFWGTRHQLCSPAQAEVDALLWTVKLAIHG